MSRINCVYLGWKTPAIHSCAEYLFQRYVRHGLADLTDVTVVVATRRAGRRLREVLLELAAQKQVGIFPPRITTVSGFPELLYKRKFPFATPLVQQFAWSEALKRTKRKTLLEFIPQPPADQSDPMWLELGAVLQRQHLELTDHQLDFASVAEIGKRLEDFTDYARWRALASVQALYLKTLDDLELWDRQTARNYAVEHQECEIGGDVVLLGTADLSRTLRAMLAQIANQVTSLVFADQRLSDRFDDFGCVMPGAWQTVSLDVEDHQILVADGPSNQADAVVYAIEALEGKYSAGDIVIGVPDVSLVPHLENKLQQFELHARWGPGRSMSASAPAQWLRIVADYLTQERYGPLAELLRHNDTYHYLSSLDYPRDAVKELDRYFDRHLPDFVGDPGVAEAPPDAVPILLDLLKELRGGSRPLNAWGDVIQDVLQRLYYDRQLNIDNENDRAILQTCDQLCQGIARFATLPESLTPNVSASTAILMLLGQIADEEVAPPTGDDVIEMVGWLDLLLDDTKVAIVTAMNDGVVPKAVSSDVFLPNALRQAIGLDDNAMRYARDAYSLHALLESRMAVRLVVGRRAASNDPLRPSRLLMATRGKKLPPRCLRLFNGEVDFAPIGMTVEHETMQFTVPRPTQLAHPIESLSVSDFARYLLCPYRFYLSKAQRLRPMDDSLTEMDARMFGDVAHHVLELFGRSGFADCSDADEIRRYLLEQLTSVALERFGSRPKPTIQVQVAQLKTRLSVFADKQAEWRQLGWKIVRTEFVEDNAELIVDGETMRLKGRIDRIDHRLVDGEDEYAVLDYKTGDAGDPPAKKHLSGNRVGEPIAREHWVDLQLPLYRHLLKSMEDMQGKRIRLGYIVLPSAAAETRFAMANWTADDLATADEAAHEVVRCVLDERFWPPAEPYPFKNFDEFSAIVQHRIFGREDLTEETLGV